MRSSEAALPGLRGGAVEVLGEEALLEPIHAGRALRVRRSRLILPAGPGRPPLSMVYSAPFAPGAVRDVPPVLLIHGLAQNRFTWGVSGRSLVGALVERGYPVLNLELRGHGLSRELGAGNATTFAEYVDDAARAIDACARPPFLVGHSLGGGVGVGASTVRPLAGLVHLAGVYAFARHNPTLRALARLSVRLERSLPIPRLRVSTGWAGELLGRLYALTDIAGYGLPVAGWVPGSMERELLEERLALGFDWTSIEVWLEMSRWARGAEFPWAEPFRAVQTPLLVAAGDADPLVSIADARLCFEAAGTPDKTFLPLGLYEVGAHFGHVDLILGTEAPARVWPALLDWMDARRG